jgi:two-component system, OmpR family, flagellar system response regulator FtcR
VILIVDRRNDVLEAYSTGFRREGVAVIGLEPDDFSSWLRCSAPSEVLAVETFVLGDCPAGGVLPARIKDKSSAPIIVLMDQRKLETTLQLLAAGADDVVEKPVHVREILARAGAIRRRSMQRVEHQVQDVRVFGDGRDPLVGGEALSLPRRERRILEYLTNNREKWIEREQLFAAVYGGCEEAVANKTIEAHISRLRRKLRSRLGYDPIACRRYVGYQLKSRGRLQDTEPPRPREQRDQASLGHVSLSL